MAIIGNGITTGAAGLDEMITVSDTEPTVPSNKVWVKETSSDVIVPTVEDFEDFVDTVILVQDAQPTDDDNSIWIKPDDNAIEIPTMDDLDEVSDEVSDVKNALTQEYILLTQDDLARGVWENRAFVSWNVRLCTKPMLALKAGDRVAIESETLQVSMHMYVDDSTTATNLLAWTTLPTETVFVIPNDGDVVITFRKQDGSVIDISDYDATVKIYSTILGRINGTIIATEEVLRTEINDVKSGLISADDFEYGNVYNGAKIPTTDSRFRSKHIMCFPFPIKITPEIGFQFVVFAYTDNYYTHTSTGWQTNAYTIPAFTRFNIVLADTANAYKNASYKDLVYSKFTFEIDSIKALNEKAEKYSTAKVPLVITEEMKGWTYYIGAGSNNHLAESIDAITFAVPMSRGDSIRITPNFKARSYYANYENGSLDDKTTLISTGAPGYRTGEEYFFVNDDCTVFFSMVRADSSSTGDYSDFPSGIDINLCARNYVKYIGLNKAVFANEIQENAFVSSYNEIAWEEHAKNFSALFNNKTNADSFLFFTDCHIMHMSSAADRENCAWKPRVRKALSYIEQLFYATPCNTLLNGGDWLGSYDTQEQALYMLSYINGAMREKFQDHFAMIVGNHDTNYQGYINSESSEADGILSQGAINATYCSGHSKSYFIHHAPTYDLYCFDTGIESSELSSSYYTNQVKWFADALEENTAEHVVIFIHMIYKSGTTVGAMFNQLSLCAKAFNSRGSYTYDGVTHNYTNASGKVAFAIGGHTHQDTIVTINDIPCVISKNASGYGNFTTLPLDLCLVDWDSAKLYLYRAEIGASTGTTREVAILT